MSKSIAELVKESASSPDQGRFEHYKDLGWLVGRKLPAGLSQQEVDKLQKIGLRWIVPSSFVKRFKYHAIVKRSAPSEEIIVYRSTFSIMGVRPKYPMYFGDVPTSVIGKCRLALAGGGVRNITVHSNAPLPIKWESEPRRVMFDPIMLGWLDDPRIVVRRNKVVDISITEAVVLGLWDAEKEISLE